jgi:hypothetical protein
MRIRMTNADKLGIPGLGFDIRNNRKPPARAKMANVRAAKQRDMLAAEDACCQNCCWYREPVGAGEKCDIGFDLVGLVDLPAANICNSWTKP